MAFDMKRNPLDDNPLFAGNEEAVQDTQPKPQNEESTEKPAEKPVRRRKKKTATDTSNDIKTPLSASERLSEASAYTRATFIVREDLLRALKAYAYTERREIKEVVNELLARALAQVEKEYAARGESLIEPPKR